MKTLVEDTLGAAGRTPAAGGGPVARGMKLGDKLILTSSAIALAVLGCGGFVAMRVYEGFQIRLAKQQALQNASLIERSVRYHMLHNRRDDVQWIIETVGRQQGIGNILVFNHAGEVAYAARRRDIGTRVTKESEGCAYCHRSGNAPVPETLTDDVARLLPGASGDRQVAIMSPIRNEPACQGCHPARQRVLGNLEVSLSIAELDRQVGANHRRLLLLLAASVLLISAAQGLITFREVTLPVSRLRAGFDHVAAGDLAYRVDITGRGELAQLSQAFNRLTGQLEAAKVKLDHWTDELSERVEHATRELQETNRRLVAAGRLKSDFVRDVSHELRAPLGSIASCLRAVLGGYAPDEQTRHGLLVRACRKTESLTRMVRDMLDLAESGETVPPGPSEPVNLAALIGKAAELLLPRAREREVSLELHLDAAAPAVRAQARDLEILVTNLLDNAVKYNRPGGKVTVSLAPAGEATRLTVADTGIGISPQELPRLFTEFYRSPAARKHEKDGTGLGLSIVKKLVEKQGGRIEVQSAAGIGTTFEIVFAAEAT